MRYRRTPLEISSPKLRHVYSPGFETPALYLHMFQEDARLYVAPLRSHGDEKFTVEINGEQRDLDRVEALIESISRESYGNWQALFSEAIRQVAAHLLWYGVARFEVLNARKGEEGGYFALQPFPTFGVWRVPGDSFKTSLGNSVMRIRKDSFGFPIDQSGRCAFLDNWAELEGTRICNVVCGRILDFRNSRKRPLKKDLGPTSSTSPNSHA